MKKKITLLILIFIISWNGFSQRPINVYFIGNSYTSSGDIPSLVKQIAADSGDNMIYLAHTPGGATFQDHASNQTVQSVIQYGYWDYVILQEQSQIPSFPEEQFDAISRPYAAELSDLAKTNACGQVMFYMTWGRENGDQEYCPTWPPVCSYEGMDDLIQERYMSLADENEAMVSPVGAVWRYIRENHPEINLYSNDGSHPSEIGSMTAAYTFYTSIFKKSPYDSNFHGTIDNTTMAIIKEAVHEVVYSDMDQWFLLEDLPIANFDYEVNELEVGFTDLSENASTYLWDFGDGNSSTDQNPTHLYGQSGTYTVKLVVEDCNRYDSYEIQIEVTALGINNIAEHKLSSYPNPTKDFLYIALDEQPEQLVLYDQRGGKVSFDYGFEDSKIKVDLRNLSEGFYYLMLTNNGKSQWIRVLRK